MATNLELYCNNNIQPSSGTTFPSANGGDDLNISGTYTTDSKGIVLSGTDATLQTTGNTTFQAVSLWFRFNDIVPSFNLFDSSGDASASFTAVTTASQARSTTGSFSAYVSGWQYGDMKQYRYDSKSGLYMHPQGTNIVEGLIGSTSGAHGRTFRNTAFANILDFDYRFSASQYCAIDINNDVSTSILGVRVALTAIWSGTAECMRYRKSDDKFLIMVEGTSDQVCILDGDTGVFTSVYSNTGITIAPRSMAVNEDTLYFIGSDSYIYSLDISSNTNVPVQLGVNTVSSTQSINYYKGKVYAQVANVLVEIDTSTGTQYSMGSPSVTQYRIYAPDFEGGYISHPTSNDRNNRAPYDFNGSDGRSYTLTEGTNTISKTYIDGKVVSSLEDMISYSYGGLHNVVFLLSNPSTSILTLFGDSSALNSPDVTVETIATFSSELGETEILFAYDLYRKNNIPSVPIPKVSVSSVTDFSVDAEAIIEIGDILGFQSLTSSVYTGTFSDLNVFSLTTDLDFLGETKSTINGFAGKFYGNGNRLSNHDDTYIFDTLGTGASINGLVFHNFYAPTLRGITLNITGTASVTNCVCCGTFFTAGAAFCDTLSNESTFQDNIVLVSDGSRFSGTWASGIVGRNAQPMTRCFFAGTSDVFIQSGANAGALFGDGNFSGENACNFNGYISGRYETGGLVGEVDNTPNGCVGLYACGSFELFNWTNNDYVGRIIGNRAGGTVLETYYYGEGDLVQLANRAHQAGQGINSATVFSERKPSIQGSNYLESDIVYGVGLKGTDTSVWAGGAFAGPDILKNVPHFVPVENFEEIHDPIGTIQVHLTNKTDYPVFMKFNFDDPNVSFTVVDREYREVNGYEAKIVSRHHTLTNSTETVTNPSGLEYYVNATSAEFDALVEPTTIIGTEAKNITDFSVYVGDIIISDFDDFSAMHLENYTGTFHGGNRYFQTADVQYPDSTLITANSHVNVFQGLFDGNGYRFLDVYINGFNSMIRLTKWSTVKNVSVHNVTMTLSYGVFATHTSASIVRHCKVTGDIVSRGPALTQNTNNLGVFEDCQVLASGNSIQSDMGAAFDTASSVKRIFVATQSGHAISSVHNELGGVMETGSTNVSKIACNMRSFLHCSRDEIGLVMAVPSGNLGGQVGSKGYYGCGNTSMLGSDNSMSCDGIAGEGTLNEFFSANSGDITMQSSGRTNPVPAGQGTLFSDFTGRIFDQNANNDPYITADVNGNQGALYSHDVTLWTAPWDLLSHLDYPSILIDVPHFIPLSDDEVVNDIACTIQMYASSPDGYSAFFKIQGDRYETDYHIDLIGNDGLPTPTDGSWVIQFTFPFAVEATKNIVFRGTTLTSVDSLTYTIGGIPFVPFPATAVTTIECKNVTDFSVYTSDIITMNDVADFQAVIGVSAFNKLNVFNMTADVSLETISGGTIFNNFEGTFDGKGYRIKNSSSWIFSQRLTSLDICTIQNVIFQGFKTTAPVLFMYGRGKLLNCVSCGTFDNVSCGLVHRANNFSSIENCYVLASGNSNFNAGMSDNVSASLIGVSKSFFCGTSEVVIENGNNDTGCIGRSISMGGGIGVNFLGALAPTGSGDIGGLSGEAKLSNGVGYYVCGDFTINQGSGLVERVIQSGAAFDELYYANKGTVVGNADINQGLAGPNHAFGATAFAEFSGLYNNVQITEDINNVRNGGVGVYSRAPGAWWSPWNFVATRPSLLKETPHFIPIESSEQHSDILGDITVELDNVILYPVFVRVDYVNETEMEVKFFSKNYVELTTGISAEIVFPLTVTKNVYYDSSVVTSTDNLTYAFGSPLGTLVPGYGTSPNAASVTDFSANREDYILLGTPADVQAMYKTNYSGTFNESTVYILLNDIDLHQETFDTANDVISGFRGDIRGNGHKLLNHQGNFLSFSSGKVADLVFLDFKGRAINGQPAMNNIVFMSGTITGTFSGSVLGLAGPSTSNVRALLHGNFTASNSLMFLGGTGASGMFLATSSGVSHTVGYNGVMMNTGAPAFNMACNLNGTVTSSTQCGLLLRERNSSSQVGGGYYASGKVNMIRNNGTSWHLMNAQGWQGRGDEGGAFTAVTGSITNNGTPETLITNSYITEGTAYATAFKDFVPGITADINGIIGGVYDTNIGLWATPWDLSLHLDHPSILKGIPHYFVAEDGDPINDVLGEVRVVTSSYPVFVEIAYSENDDGSDRFTYTVLDTTYTEDTGAVVLITYPHNVQSTTQIWNNGEEITSFNQRSYTVGSPLFASKISPISIEVSWLPVSGATSYRLTSRKVGTQIENVSIASTQNTKGFARQLQPETEYVFSLYTVSGGVRTLQYTVSETTLVSSSENYGELVDSIEDTVSGVFDLTALSSENRSRFTEFIEDVFPAGSKLKVELGGKKVNSTVVHRGGNVAVADSDAVITPFNSTDTGQFIEITSQDSTSLRLDYDETSNEFVVGTETYAVGQSFIFDGKKVKIYEV